MRSLRFSVSAFMALIVAIAGLLAILRFPSPLLANALFSIVVLVLSLALTGVVFARGVDRAWYAGALIAGGIAFVLHFVPWMNQRFGNFLVSAAVADILYENFAAPVRVDDGEEGNAAANASLAPPAPSGGRFMLASGFGAGGGKGFGGGNQGFGVTAAELPSAFESWTAVERPSEDQVMGFVGRRTVGGVTIFNTAPFAMQRIVDCLAVILSAIIGGFFARQCAARPAAVPDPPDR